MAQADEWIEVRRFDDPLEAQMAKDFLVDHGIRVGIRGNSGATGLLNRFTTVLDIRLVVPREDLESASEALEALRSAPAAESPFRGPRPLELAEERLVRRRSPAAAAVLSVLLPFGAGHLYAQHGAAAAVFFAGTCGALVVHVFAGRPAFLIAWAVLVVLDGLGAFFATRRYNASVVPSEGTQRAWATVAVVLAFTAAVAVGG
jgi:hypothetical protein